MTTNIHHSKVFINELKQFFLDLKEPLSKICFEYFGKSVTLIDKGEEGFVSPADFLIQDFIAQQINIKFPDHKLLSEESPFELTTEIINQEKNLWILDPIDGTHNFIKGLPFYAISLAFYSKGVGIGGMLVAPHLQEAYYVFKGEGIFFNGITNPFKKMKNQFIPDKTFKHAYFSCPPFRINTTLKNSETLFFLNELTIQALAKRRLGATSLEMAYVSLGKLDGFWGRKIKIWDIATALIMAKENSNLTLNLEFNSFELLDSSLLCVADDYTQLFQQAIADYKALP